MNNPSAEEVALWENISKHATFVKSASGQLEKGKEGTPHIQGILKTDSVRFSAVKKLLPRAHIEKARNAKALEQYATKEETRLAPLTSSKREVLMATPATIQKRLFDSLYYTLSAHSLSVKMMEDTIVYVLVPIEQKALLKFDAKDFVEKLRTHEWTNYVKANAQKIMDRIYATLIEEGYYNVEFIASNNLLNGGFKKFLVEILIRHALHAPSPPSPQEQPPPPPEEDLS